MIVFLFCFPLFSYSQTEKINDLLKNLKEKDENVRNSAVDNLVEIGQPALKPLLDALNDKDLLESMQPVH
jgi:HEAT repeat protein